VNDPGFRVRVAAKTRDFSLLQNAKTVSGAHTASCSMGTGGSFSGVKRRERDVNQAPPSSAQLKNEWSYTSTPLCAFMACIGKNAPTLSALPKTVKDNSQLRRVCLFVRPHGTIQLPLDGFLRNLIPQGFFFFRESIHRIQDSLKFDKNNGYFTCRPMYIYGNISLNSCKNEKCFCTYL